MTINQSWTPEFRAKIAESGIPEGLIGGLGVESYDEIPGLFDNSNVRKGPGTQGILIRYYTPGGADTGFSRYRYLTNPIGSWGKLAGIRDKNKYVQPQGTAPKLYFPRLRGMDWVDVCGDPTKPLVITEGEFKAIKSSLSILPTVGLGGVWSWRSGERSIEDLNLIVWEGRTTYIIFDSDIVYNLNVQRAERALCMELLGRGSKPFTTRLPYKDNAKVGIDDWLVAGNDPQDLDFEEFGLSLDLHKLNDSISLLKHPFSIYAKEVDEDGKDVWRMKKVEHMKVILGPLKHRVTVLEDNYKDPPEEYEEIEEIEEYEEMVKDRWGIPRPVKSKRRIKVQVKKEKEKYEEYEEMVKDRWGIPRPVKKKRKLERPKKAGRSRLRDRPLFDVWVEWPYRSVINNLLYVPGGGEVMDGGWNTWRGWGCEPVEGSIAPFAEYFGYICTNMEPEHRKWLLQWLAYPIQHPGTKLYTTVLLWSPYKGVGKSGLGYTMKEIYGENWSKIGDSHLVDKFNDHLINKQFIMGDEIAGKDKRIISDKIKTMITQQEILIEEKFFSKRLIKDIVNYLFTSNHPDAFYIEDNDRRLFVHEITELPKEPVWYSDYFDWLRNKGGREALFYWLLNIDLTGFIPTAPAPMTLSKEYMTSMGRSSLSTWVSDLRHNPDSVLKLGKVICPYCLMTAEEVLDFYDPEGVTRTSITAVSKELSRQMFIKILGKQIRINGVLKFIFVVRDSQELRNALTPAYVTEFYRAERELFTKKPCKL